VATRIDVLDEADSTQDEAVARANGGPVLVIAHRQHRGRGRSGSAWIPAPRAVSASLAWRPDWPTDRLPVLTLEAGLAATDVVQASLEWPNDLYRGDRKIGGILVEGHGDTVVAGLGLNLWWPDPPEGLGAVHEDDPGPEAVVDIAKAWAERLLDRAAAGPDDWDRAAYLERCTTLGRLVSWEPGGSGTVLDVAVDGGLVVESAHGVETLHSGAVSRLR